MVTFDYPGAMGQGLANGDADAAAREACSELGATVAAALGTNDGGRGLSTA
jgi:hypothetical protein